MRRELSRPLRHNSWQTNELRPRPGRDSTSREREEGREYDNQAEVTGPASYVSASQTLDAPVVVNMLN